MIAVVLIGSIQAGNALCEQALMVLSHVASIEATTSDRFYRALYEALLHPELPTSAKQVRSDMLPLPV